MEQLTNQSERRDPAMWQLAKNRASFRYHLLSYVVMNSFFWALWFFTGGREYTRGNVPWPVFPMLGWGIGLAFHYLGAFVFPKSDLAQKEYEKLMRNRK